MTTVSVGSSYVVSSEIDGIITLHPPNGRSHRRVLYINSYGGREILNRVEHGDLPPHHLWGCQQLVNKGYEVGLLEPLRDFYFHRSPLPHDLRYLSYVRSWLGSDGIVYCGHNVLFWLPLLHQLGVVRARIVSLLFGREPLRLASAHSGIIALNRAAEQHARALAPHVTVARLSWGADLSFFPSLAYRPDAFLACGQTCRDYSTLAHATRLVPSTVRVITNRLPKDVTWPPNAHVFTGGERDNTVTYKELLYDFYDRCAASLIILKPDPEQYTGVGFTNLLEAMAMARPVIVTRTGAMPTEIDVEEAGCGIHVPPSDPDALATAINRIAADPEGARLMGVEGRRLCETHYNIERFGEELHNFFERL